MAHSNGDIVYLTKAEERKLNEEEVKSFLEMVSVQLAISFADPNDRDHHILYQYLTEDFSFDFTPDVEFPWPRAKTLKDFIDHLENLQTVNPSWNLEAFNFSAVLDYRLDSAVVWWTSGPSGHPANESTDWSTNRESVSKFSWRKRPVDGGWECFKILTIRGGSTFGDFN